MARGTREKRSTSLDVARLAGVSHTTVSFVINDRHADSIPEETRARVLKAVAELDYHPHEAARSLRARASNVIAAAVPEAYNPHHLGTVEGAEAYARSCGYSILRAITNFDPVEERRCFTWLKQRRIDALILSTGDPTPLVDEIGTLREGGYIITGLGLLLDGIDGVAVEQQAGEQQAIEHLISLGHRRIGYVYGLGRAVMWTGRLESCLKVVQSHGLPVNPHWIQRCGPGPEDGFEAVGRLLAATSESERPTAIVVVNDLVATGVLAALYNARVNVPREISVLSFDNTRPSMYMVPPLTTVDCQGLDMGKEAARLTIERLANPAKPPEHLTTRATLVVRDSTGPAPIP
jgi:DNA-binding LacI/PurR family transcriptional regulator